MPETKGAKKILHKMEKEYGKKEGIKVYYATANKQERSFSNFKPKK